jgi:hypothetical protein
MPPGFLFPKTGLSFPLVELLMGFTRITALLAVFFTLELFPEGIPPVKLELPAL